MHAPSTHRGRLHQPVLRTAVKHTSSRVRCSSKQRIDVDVVVVGAGIGQAQQQLGLCKGGVASVAHQPPPFWAHVGIIGLLTAKTLLQKGLTVALVERKQLCAGATGAGQVCTGGSCRAPSTSCWYVPHNTFECMRMGVCRAISGWRTAAPARQHGSWPHGA